MGKHEIYRSARARHPVMGLRAIREPDENAHDDGVLMHDVTTLNTELGRYVLRYLDSDAGRAAPLSVAAELGLADKMIKVAGRLRERAERRRDTDPTATMSTPADWPAVTSLTTANSDQHDPAP